MSEVPSFLLLMLVVGVFLVGWRQSSEKPKRDGYGDGRIFDDDPHHITALNLSDEERVLFYRRTPDPKVKIMTVRFVLQKHCIDLDTKSKQRYPARDVPWAVHADGRLSRAEGVLDAMRVRDLVLDKDFVVGAVLYVVIWPPRLHATPPHIRTSGGMYRLVWRKNNWYLNVADEEYRARVIARKKAVAGARLKAFHDRQLQVQ